MIALALFFRSTLLEKRHMSGKLEVKAGQRSTAGIKPGNDDSCGIKIPDDALRMTKGITAVIADGMSGSEGGKEAAEACVLGFLSDYYSTPESWTVKNSGAKVLGALNRWLCAQGRQEHDSRKGMVTTFSALIIKSTTAHLLHVGDTRIYRFRGKDLECLTRDHRVVISKEKQYLSRAMGIDVDLQIDYKSMPIEEGDLFLLVTDGVHEYLSAGAIKTRLKNMEDPEKTVREIIEEAAKNGSHDNLTCQIILIEKLPLHNKEDLYQRLTELPFPPPLSEGMVLDGYRIVRELHASKQTQIYLAVDTETKEEVVLKTPSVNYEDDPGYIERFMHEEWAGRRLNSPHILKIKALTRRRSCLYFVTEYVKGETLRQWMCDHPHPTLIGVRKIINQVVTGLMAFHQKEVIHRDLKPENILIDKHGTVKIIDFGSSKIAGIEEINVPWERGQMLGTLNYTAPEYLAGSAGTEHADLFSLGVITYEMLCGALPYKEALNLKNLNRISYQSATKHNPEIPLWLDKTLEKAVHKNPGQRYTVLSEFLYDLSHPNPAFLSKDVLPLLERDPVTFWKTLAVFLIVINIILLYFVS